MCPSLRRQRKKKVCHFNNFICYFPYLETYHIGQPCKHRVVSHKHRYNVVHTHRSLASKASSTHSQKYEVSLAFIQFYFYFQASVTSRTNLQSCSSQAFNSTSQIEQIDLTQPCQQHIHKPMQQRRMERIDLTQQRQQRIDQVERNLPYQQQVYYRNFRPNESLRFGHLGEKNALCSMCVCRWANKRLY
jgi:hypothetical protein